MNYKNQFIKKALELNKSINISIHGPCMCPLLKDGENVLVYKDKEYSVGDIILYEDGKGKLICHRINYTDGKLVITSGDNNLLYDPPIYYKNIFGKLSVKGNSYKNSNPIVSMAYNDYIESKIEDIHSTIALFNTISGENLKSDIQFFGFLPPKKQKLILLKGLLLEDFPKIPIINFKGHVLFQPIQAELEPNC